MSAADRRTLTLLTLAFALLSTVFAFVVPLFENYDEQTHIDRARYTARHGIEPVGPDLRRTHGAWAAERAVGLVDVSGEEAWKDVADERPRYRRFRDYPGGDSPQFEPCPGPCQNYQYTQPPGWYVLNAPVADVADEWPFPITVLVMRLFAVVLGSPIVVLAWWTARAFWPAVEEAAIAVAGLVSGFGPLAYTVSAANNDALMLTCVFASVALMAQLLRSGLRWKLVVPLALVVGLGAFVKIQLLVVAPIAGTVLLVARTSGMRRLHAVTLYALLVSPGVAWWLEAFLGDSVLTPEASEILGPPSEGPWNDAVFPVYALQRLPTLLDRFWGIYGFPIVIVPWPARVVLWAAVAALAVAGLRRVRPFGPRWVLVWAVPVALTGSVLWASFKTYRTTGEIRGMAPRYLHPAISLLALAAVAPVRKRLDRASVATALVAGTAVVGGLGSLLVVSIGLYASASPSEILARAAVAAPVSSPGQWWTALVGAWLLVVAASASSARRTVSGTAVVSQQREPLS